MTSHSLPLSAGFSGCLCDAIGDFEAGTNLDNHRWCVRFVGVDDALGSPEIRAAWDRLVAESSNPTVLYQSPQWLEHLAITRPGNVYAVAIVEDDSGIIGVAPLQRRTIVLQADLKRHSLVNVEVPSVAVLGSRPLLPEDSVAHRRLFETIGRRFPGHSLFFRNIADGSRLRQLLDSFAGNRWIAHTTDEPQRHHLLRLEDSFDEFIGAKAKRTRNKLRQLLKHFEGSSPSGGSLVRIGRPEQIDNFVTLAAAISRRSWQHQSLGIRVPDSAQERARLRHLAEQGILRAYLLNDGDTPCAFVIGHQHDGVFHLDEIGFDQGLADRSPGTALLLLVIRDLISGGGIRLLNFGEGDAPYKARFSSQAPIEVPLLLMPATPANRVLAAAHSAFLRGRRWLRSRLARQASATSS
jgi:CelD/BcsL family acetyltransferase involved in cellulose biosynthesis